MSAELLFDGYAEDERQDPKPRIARREIGIYRPLPAVFRRAAKRLNRTGKVKFISNCTATAVGEGFTPPVIEVCTYFAGGAEPLPYFER